MAKRKTNQRTESLRSHSGDDTPDSLAAAAVRTVWSFPRRVRVTLLVTGVIVAGVFAVWMSLPESSKKDVLTLLGFASPGESPSTEIESLIRFYDNRAKDIEKEMEDTAERWRHTGPADPSHSAWEHSIALLETKRSRFRELHQRHIAALRASQLTLAQIYANAINKLLIGEDVAYDRPPPFREFSTQYRDPESGSRAHFDPAAYTEILLDESQPDHVRLSAAEIITRRCDALGPCVSALGAVFDFRGSYYLLWGEAKARLCEAGEKAQPIVPILIKLLSHRDTYPDWRSWLFAMEVVGCIGPAAADAVPHIASILAKPNFNPDEYYNITYIQEVAAQALGRLGTSAAVALPALREASTAADPDVKEAALAAIRQVEGK